MMVKNHATQNEVHEYRDSTRAKYPDFKVDSNGYGVRVECPVCHNSTTSFPEMWMVDHPSRCEG